MSQILAILTENERLSESEKSLMSNTDQNRKSSNKKINFIERNKELVSNSNKQQQHQTDIIIRYLNDDISEEAKVATEIDDNKEDIENQSEFEISIISNHSSTVSENNDLNKPNNQLIQGDEYKPENELVFSSDYLKLNNMNQNEQAKYEADTDCNIIKYEQDKSRIRSQFMQRFGTVNTKKKQIIPNLIETNSSECILNQFVNRTPLSTMTTADSSPSVNQNYFPRQCAYDQDQLTTASIAASLAAMSVVNSQPFAQIHNNLDDKITNVLKELEILRRSDEKLNEKLLKKRKSKRAVQSDDSDDELVAKKSLESEHRIKYLEKLQEKQFDMMSQLINVIGNENSNANLTAQNGKESLNKFKKQISQISVGNESDYEDYSKFTNNLNRSRTQSVKKRSNSKKKIDISPSPSSTGRTCCKAKNSNQILRSSTDFYKKQHKKIEFLEELLDSDPLEPVIIQSTIPTNIQQSLKSTTSSINNLNESQPLLFDKYLNEVKTKLKENANESSSRVSLKSTVQKEKLNESKHKELTNRDSNENIAKKPSMFSDIKEVLKAVEYSKSKIDSNLAELTRERDNKMFYLLNSNLDDKNDRVRIKKMVDGCINAIADDVKKEVTQKLIDESKHVKLIAEKDTNPSRNRQSRVQQQKTTKIAQRSASAIDLPNSKTVSQTNKYIGKIFGKSLLEQIKFEKNEEVNQKLKKQILEQQKMKRDLELRLQKEQNQTQQQRQTRLFKNISNKNQPNNRKKVLNESIVDTKSEKVVPHTPRLIFDPQRPAFASSQIKPTYSEIKYQERPKSSNDNRNVALITISPVEISNISPAPTLPFPTKPKELIKQNLPPVSISPTLNQAELETRRSSTTSSLNQNKSELQKNQQIEDNETFDVNQSGAGIHLPGYNRPKISSTTFDRNNISSNSNLISDKHINQLSNETNQLEKQRDLLENRAFDWLEQELLARFISQLANSEPHIHDDNNQLSREYSYAQNETDDLDIKDSEIMNAIGREGLQLFIDMGQPVDPDLVQALIREVLEEKVSSITSNKEIVPEDKPTITALNNGPPMPSPRTTMRKSFDNFDQQQFFINEMKTPIATPTQSPPLSPRRAVLTPQVSVEKELKINEVPVQPPIQVPQLMAYNLLEEDESLLEETLNEQEDVDLELDEIDSKYKLVQTVATPEQTPVPSPTPSNQYETPIDTSISEKIVPKPKEPPQPAQRLKSPSPPIPPVDVKTFRSKSMQCDEIAIQYPVMVKKVPKPVQISHYDSTTDLTESTQYTSDDMSSTITSSKSNAKDDDEDTYFSEGAWLLSKSEGQIIPMKQNDYVNLDLNSAAKSLALSPRKRTDTVASDGELRLDQIDSGEMFLYGNNKHKNGVNRIVKMPESGEVFRNNPNNEKSEGEIDNSGELVVQNKRNDKNKSIDKKFSTSKKSNISKIDKTIVDLNISPQKNSLNNIKIESLSNEMRNKDTSDFERKLFSSTPDTTMHRIPSIEKAIVDDEEFLDDYDSEDEQEVEIEYSP